MNPKKYQNIAGHILVVLGSIGMVAGAFDPMEGSVVIFIGSALVVLGTFLNRNERRFLGYRVLVFVLVAIGVAAMWALSSIGGIGGATGPSMWWGVLILPYLIGWSMGIWGPGNPRWFLWLGIVSGLWFLVLCGIVLSHPSRNTSATSAALIIVLGSTGVLTIGGCISRLRHRIS